MDVTLIEILLGAMIAAIGWTIRTGIVFIKEQILMVWKEVDEVKKILENTHRDIVESSGHLKVHEETNNQILTGITNQLSYHDDRIKDHEKRIKQIEQ